MAIEEQDAAGADQVRWFDSERERVNGARHQIQLRMHNLRMPLSADEPRLGGVELLTAVPLLRDVPIEPAVQRVDSVRVASPAALASVPARAGNALPAALAFSWILGTMLLVWHAALGYPHAGLQLVFAMLAIASSMLCALAWLARIWRNIPAAELPSWRGYRIETAGAVIGLLVPLFNLYWLGRVTVALVDSGQKQQRHSPWLLGQGLATYLATLLCVGLWGGAVAASANLSAGDENQGHILLGLLVGTTAAVIFLWAYLFVRLERILLPEAA